MIVKVVCSTAQMAHHYERSSLSVADGLQSAPGVSTDLPFVLVTTWLSWGISFCESRKPGS